MPMRDGIRLATDVYRPARDGELGRRPLADDPLPHAVRQDRAALHRDRRLLRAARLRGRAAGPARPPPLRGHEGVLPHRDAAHRQRRLRHDRVDRRAAVVERPGRHGRQLVRRDHAGPPRARAPAAPDRDLARRRADEHRSSTRRARAARCSCTCSGRSSSTPPTRRTCRATRPSRRRSGTTCATCGSSSGSWPWHKGELALRHVPALEQTLEDYCTRGAYDECWARKENDFTRYWHEHADVPATMSTGWYDGFPHADTEYFAAMAAKNATPQRLIVGPWSHVGMRGDASWTLDVDFGPDSRLGRAALLRRAAALLRRASCRRRGRGPLDDPPVRIFVMGGGSGRKTELGKLDHGGRWRDEQEWPLARAVRDDVAPRTATARSRAEPRRRRAAALHVRPRGPRADDRRQLLRRRRAPGGGRGDGADVDAAPQPGAAAAQHHDAGPRRPEGVARRLHRAASRTGGCRERADVLVYQTEPLAEPVEVTGRVRGRACGSRRPRRTPTSPRS